MAKKILILSASLRAGSNSEAPATPRSRPPAPWARPLHNNPTQEVWNHEQHPDPYARMGQDLPAK